MGAILAVTAVPAELRAIAGPRGGNVTVGPYADGVHVSVGAGEVIGLAGGVGPAAAAAATVTAICLAGPFDQVISLGIGGGFSGVSPISAVAVADHIVAADLGADSPEGFLPIEALGLGSSSISCSPQLVAVARARLPEAVIGPVVTVTTGTGTAARAAWLRRRHAAVAEAMEGFGVATAAARHGVPVLELRAVSNLVGERDRASWQIGKSLRVLADAWDRLVAKPL
jgi:futalosine hydrolase